MAKQLLGNLKELFSPFFALKDHAHGLITKDGVISGQVSKNVVTDSDGKITTEAKPTIPSANATATNIKMNGTQSAGSLTTFAKADHIHPVDTSRAAASHTHDDRYYTETEVNTKLSDYLTTDDASATYQPKGSYATASHGHGKVTSGGTLSETTDSVKNVVVTDTTNNNLRVINKLPFSNLNITKNDITNLGIPTRDTFIEDEISVEPTSTSSQVIKILDENIVFSNKSNWVITGEIKVTGLGVRFQIMAPGETSKDYVAVGKNNSGNLSYWWSTSYTSETEKNYNASYIEANTWYPFKISKNGQTVTFEFNNDSDLTYSIDLSYFDSIELLTLNIFKYNVNGGSVRNVNLSLGDSVYVTPTKTSGIEIGKINVNGKETILYQQDNNTTYSADESTLTKSSSNVFSLKDSSNYVKKSSTNGYIKNDGTVGTPTNTTYSADNNTLQLSSTTFSVKDGGITNAKLADKSSLITEYIVGTHGTTATPTWTGTSTKITSLQAGQVIFFKMTSAGTSAGDTLNLTLADGTTTGTKNVYYNATTRLTTHFPINTILELVYDGTNWLCTAIQNTNNFDRINNAGQIISGEAIPTNTLIYSKNNGSYYKIASNGTLDIRYPIFWVNTAVTSGETSTGYNIYSVYPTVNIATTVNGKTLTASKMCYLEGTLNENIFTISSNVFVDDTSLTNDKYYIQLGYMTSTTNLRFTNNDRTVYKKTSDGLIPVGYDKLSATIIPNGTSTNKNSLNNYTSLGFYYQSSNANTTYIEQLPESGKAFWLLVEDWGTANYTKQTLTHYNSNRTYIRIRNAGNWGAWKEVSNVSEVIVSTHTSATSAWTGTSTQIASLAKGTVIYYNLKQDPTTSNVTLNLTLSGGGTTGAKIVYFNGSQLTNQYPKNSMIGMVYNGTNWVVISNYKDTNTTYGADRGISNVSGKFGHSNTAITAQTTSALKKIKYDTYGHITGTDNVTASDIPTPSPTAIKVTSLGNSNNTYEITGEITFIKTNKMVICDFYFHGKVNSTANTPVYICNIPSDYSPSTIYTNTTYYGSNHKLMCNVADATTSTVRNSYVQATMVNNVWQLQYFTYITSGTPNIRGQLMWFTD